MNKKYALCIGNNYPGTSAQLSGCVNDAWDWSAFLTNQGYKVETIIECDRSHALDALQEMVAKTGFGDKFVFTYSGHGTWIPDSNGDEADRRDEALVMTDYQSGGLLTDDDMHNVMSNGRFGASRLIISDSCFSGTVNRFLARPPTALKPDDAEIKPRFLSPIEFFPMSEARAVELEEEVPSEPRPSASLVSGCAEGEYSYDGWFLYEDRWRANGAFTRAALDTYRPGMSLIAWYRAIRQTLPNGDYSQSPQLSSMSRYRYYSKAL